MRRVSLAKEEPAGLRRLGISPARKRIEVGEPTISALEPPASFPDQETLNERLKTLEYEGLPITTPEAKEALGKALAIPRGAVEAALATGTGMINFMAGWSGYRMMSELAAGRPLEEAIEKGGGGLYTYEPETDWGRKITEVVSKPFELLRRGATWLAPKIVEGLPLIQEFLKGNESARHYAETTVGTMIEAGTLVAFGESLKTITRGRKPTRIDIERAAKEALKEKKVEFIEKEVEAGRVEPAPEVTPPEPEVVPRGEPTPKPTPVEVPTPEVAPGMYKGLRPGTWEWKQHWIRHPEEQKAMLKYRKRDETLAPEIAKTEEGLPIEPEPEVVLPPEPTIVEVGPEPKPYKMPFIDRKTKGRVIEMDAEGIPPDEIAAKLRTHEGDVVRVLESLERPKKTVKMEDVESEFRKILEKTKDPDELYEAAREITTRYEDNLDVGFADEFEMYRYREWGDQIMGKINAKRRKAGLPEGSPTDRIDWFGETADFGGFQKMYEAVVDRIKARGRVRGRPISPQGGEMLDRGEVIKRRKTKYGYKPPIYESEYYILKNAAVLRRPFLGKFWLQNPSRVYRQAGGEALVDMLMHNYHKAESSFIRTWDAAKSSIRDLRGKLNWRERRRVMAYAISKQPKGDALLKWTKIKKVPKELTPKEMAVYNAMRERYESLYTRLNRIRKVIGEKPLPKTDDYFTFFRHMTIMERMGFQPWRMPADILNNQFVSMRATPFKFAKARGHALYKLEMDPFYVLEQYTRSALRHIHLSPFTAKVNEFLTTIKDPVTGHKFNIYKENPHLGKAIHDWNNYIAGLKTEVFGSADRIMLQINSNLTAAILGANVRSAMIQVTALRNTVAKIGYADTMYGIMTLLDPKMRTFAWKKSKVLSGRLMDVSVEDAIRAIRAKRFGATKTAIARASLKPLQILDLETAKACWNGAYRHGMKRLKMNQKRAIEFADDVVTETQASAMPGDIAPIQRYAPGKVLTLFQTFTINDWNFLVRDVLGWRNANITTPKAFANVMRYVAATTLFNILMEDILHINSPFPTPIRAFRESLERGDGMPSLAWNVGKEFIEPIPIVGSARYGIAPGGPGLELSRETLKYIRDDPFQRPWWDIFGRWLGMPGTAQVSKMKRAIKRGETPYGQVVGTYTPPEKRKAERKPKAVRRIGRTRR